MQKRMFSLVLVLVMILSSLTVQAQHSSSEQVSKGENDGTFSDVSDKHWAYEYIKIMSQLGIINGYQGKFNPEDNVSKEEFSKMMVLTLQLDLINPSTPTFVDVTSKDWSYKYVETAKGYLTGYGVNYYPKLDAEREDLAYAVVKALGISIEDADLSLLDQFEDKNEISTVLLPYLAKAVEEGIMIGSDGELNPRDGILRAEAATLLARLITSEKVIFDDTKTIYEDADNTEDVISSEAEELSELDRSPTLSYTIASGGLKLDWSTTDDDDFKYYKVVFSTSDSTPVYPEDGYLVYIGNANESDYIAYAGKAYNGGNIDKIKSGSKYYVSITAVYSNGAKYYPSNTITVTLP